MLYFIILVSLLKESALCSCTLIFKVSVKKSFMLRYLLQEQTSTECRNILQISTTSLLSGSFHSEHSSETERILNMFWCLPVSLWKQKLQDMKHFQFCCRIFMLWFTKHVSSDVLKLVSEEDLRRAFLSPTLLDVILSFLLLKQFLTSGAERSFMSSCVSV